jgi:hypothetical protein
MRHGSEVPVGRVPCPVRVPRVAGLYVTAAELVRGWPPAGRHQARGGDGRSGRTGARTPVATCDPARCVSPRHQACGRPRGSLTEGGRSRKACGSRFGTASGFRKSRRHPHRHASHRSTPLGTTEMRRSPSDGPRPCVFHRRMTGERLECVIFFQAGPYMLLYAPDVRKAHRADRNRGHAPGRERLRPHPPIRSHLEPPAARSAPARSGYTAAGSCARHLGAPAPPMPFTTRHAGRGAAQAGYRNPYRDEGRGSRSRRRDRSR